jgi:hypothetical protein
LPKENKKAYQINSDRLNAILFYFVSCLITWLVPVAASPEATPTTRATNTFSVFNTPGIK